MDNGACSYRRFRDSGDENALCEIIRDYKDGLTFYLFGITGNLGLAEELCEDTFVLLGTKKPKDKGKGSFKTWLYTIGRNVTIDYMRKAKRHEALPIDDALELSSEFDLEKSYLKEEEKVTLHRAIRRLKPEYRQILTLIYFENFSDKEAAKILGKSEHSIETLLWRARASLKSQLETEGYHYEKL